MRSALATAFFLCACQSPVPLPDQTTNSRWVRYHHWAGQEPCLEALELLDAQVDFIATRFGLSASAVDYYKFRDTEEHLSARVCEQLGSVACTFSSTSYGTAWADTHELVHAIWSHVGTPPQLFVEGIAVVLGCGQTGYSGNPIPLNVDVEALADTRTWNASFHDSGASNYAVAGSLVRWLIDAKGPQAFTDFYAAAGAVGADGISRAFEKVYGMPFSEAVAAWKASGPGPEGSFCLSAADPCDSPAMLDGQAGRTSLTRRLSCIPQVVTVAAGSGEAVAASLRSSERPVSAVLEACVPKARLEPVMMPAELFGLSPATPGKELEVRSFGLGTKGRLRILPARASDRDGAMLDPQGNAFGGAWGGELTVTTLPSPGALFSSGCPAQQLPVGANTWAVQVTGDLGSLGGSGVIAMRSPTPFTVSAMSFSNLNVGLSCGAGCGAACSSSEPNAEYSITLVAQTPGQRFRLSWVMER